LYSPPAWPNLERYFAALRARPGARGVLDLGLE
jgi:glutathione S-transferase